MINHFKIISCGLIALIIAGVFGVGIYVLTITNDKLTIVLTFVLVFFVDSIFGIYIINSKRHINVKACWILSLVYLPVIGVVLFLIFGIKSFSERTLSQHRLEMINYSKYEEYKYSNEILRHQKNSVFSYGYITSLRPVYQGNEITIIANNTDLYEQTINLIRSAKKFIHIQVYMINDGFFLRTLCAELIRKAKQNIKIRFIYDWYGSYHRFSNKILRELRKNGIEIAIFNPKGFNRFKGLTNYRSHKKAIIVDNEKVIYGSFNIGDEYLNMNHECFNWKDLNFVVTGEIVNSLNLGFCHDWVHYTGNSLNESKKITLTKIMPRILRTHAVKNITTDIQVAYNTPLFIERSVSDLTIKLISNAKRNIKIATPYFLPTSDVKQAIRIALKSGVEVELMLPGKKDDKDFILTMNRNAYQELLELGCKIYEYNGFLHSKYLVVDERYVLTGSNNFDVRSFIINFENCLLIDNHAIAKQIGSIFAKDKNNAREFNMRIILPIVRSIRHKWQIWLLNMYKPIL